MAIPIVMFPLRPASLALGLLAPSGCDQASDGHAVAQAGRYVVVSVHGPSPGTTEVIQVDSATGASWRLARTGTQGAQDELGWHPIANLTIESRTPYYPQRRTPNRSSAEGQ